MAFGADKVKSRNQLPAGKPGRGKEGSWPVSRVLWNALRRPGSHSSGPAVACRLEQPTREQREPRYRPPIWSCSGWGLPCRFCCQKRGGLLPHRFTIAVLIAETWADYSLWHFPSPRGVRPLTGILLCGARTFLCASELRSDCPASFGMDYRIGKPGSPDFSCGMTSIRCAAKSQPSQQLRLRPPCGGLPRSCPLRKRIAQRLPGQHSNNLCRSGTFRTAIRPRFPLYGDFDLPALTATQHCPMGKQKKRGVLPLACPASLSC